MKKHEKNLLLFKHANVQEQQKRSKFSISLAKIQCASHWNVQQRTYCYLCLQMLKSSKNVLIFIISLATIQCGSHWNVQQRTYCYLCLQMLKSSKNVLSLAYHLLKFSVDLIEMFTKGLTVIYGCKCSRAARMF